MWNSDFLEDLIFWMEYFERSLLSDQENWAYNYFNSTDDCAIVNERQEKNVLEEERFYKYNML